MPRVGHEHNRRDSRGYYSQHLTLELNTQTSFEFYLTLDSTVQFHALSCPESSEYRRHFQVAYLDTQFIGGLNLNPDTFALDLAET